jgi:hypothetical protein
LKKALQLQAIFLVVACALRVVASRRLEFFPIALLLLVLLIWILVRKTKKLSKLVVASPLPQSEEGPSPGSADRPVGNVRLFLEDIRAWGFVPSGILDVGNIHGGVALAHLTKI